LLRKDYSRTTRARLGVVEVSMEAAYKVVLLRHGESTWNKENRFTGWTDVELAESGIKEAHNAAKVCSSISSGSY